MLIRLHKFKFDKKYDSELNYVYILYNKGCVVYIGKTINLRQRILQHTKGKEKKDFDVCFYNMQENYILSDRLEKTLIRFSQPIYNKNSKTFNHFTDKNSIELYKKRVC